MTQKSHTSMAIAEVRELASRFDVESIEKCMDLALRGQNNPCYAAGELEHVMNMLAKSSFVRGQMRIGMPIAVAIRELGKRMRVLRAR